MNKDATAETLQIPADPLPPDFPVGLGTPAPDDLGDWWMDLGFVDFAGLAV